MWKYIIGLLLLVFNLSIATNQVGSLGQGSELPVTHGTSPTMDFNYDNKSYKLVIKDIPVNHKKFYILNIGMHLNENVISDTENVNVTIESNVVVVFNDHSNDTVVLQVTLPENKVYPRIIYMSSSNSLDPDDIIASTTLTYDLDTGTGTVTPYTLEGHIFFESETADVGSYDDVIKTPHVGGWLALNCNNVYYKYYLQLPDTIIIDKFENYIYEDSYFILQRNNLTDSVSLELNEQKYNYIIEYKRTHPSEDFPSLSRLTEPTVAEFRQNNLILIPILLRLEDHHIDNIQNVHIDVSVIISSIYFNPDGPEVSEVTQVTSFFPAIHANLTLADSLNTVNIVPSIYIDSSVVFKSNSEYNLDIAVPILPIITIKPITYTVSINTLDNFKILDYKYDGEASNVDVSQHQNSYMFTFNSIFSDEKDLNALHFAINLYRSFEANGKGGNVADISLSVTHDYTSNHTSTLKSLNSEDYYPINNNSIKSYVYKHEVISPLSVTNTSTSHSVLEVEFYAPTETSVSKYEIEIVNDSFKHVDFEWNIIELTTTNAGTCSKVYVTNNTITFTVDSIGLCYFSYSVPQEITDSDTSTSINFTIQLHVSKPSFMGEDSLYTVYEDKLVESPIPPLQLVNAFFYPAIHFNYSQEVVLSSYSQEISEDPDSDVEYLYNVYFQYPGHFVQEWPKFILMIDGDVSNPLNHNGVDCKYMSYEKLKIGNEEYIVYTHNQTHIFKDNEVYTCHVLLSSPQPYKNNIKVSVKSAYVDIQHEYVVFNYTSTSTDMILSNVTAIADYETRRVQMAINITSPDSTNHDINSYYLMYTDNFMSKPLNCSVEYFPIDDSVSQHPSDLLLNTIPIISNSTSFIAIGPLTHKVYQSAQVNCYLDISLKFNKEVTPIMYIIPANSMNLDKRDEPIVFEDDVTIYAYAVRHFAVNHNPVEYLPNSPTSVMSWRYYSKSVKSVNAQIEEAKRMLSETTDVPLKNIYLISLVYLNNTKNSNKFNLRVLDDSLYSPSYPYHSTSNSLTIQAQFGFHQNQFSFEDLQTAMDNMRDNSGSSSLEDLSTSAILDNIIQQCLADNLGCGALCAPCTGREKCISNYDCLSGFCSFGQCTVFDIEDADVSDNASIQFGYFVGNVVLCFLLVVFID